MANIAGYSDSHLLASGGGGGTFATILCCMCSVEIQQNPANMCVACLRQNCDITEGILRQLTIHSCRGCGRFLCPPWQTVQLESKELLAACLRKIPGLSKVKLIDAVWIWTEPHSMRLKIKLTVQKEVMNGAVLQQAALVDFTVRNQQCKNCEASYAQGVWHAVVQVRQRVSHKRTFFFLEQLLLKHGAHSDTINIVTYKDGMDFYFKERQPAVRFLDFLSHHVPTKSKYARKLVSADHKGNVGDFKHNYFVEIIPVCKDDLAVLPLLLARSLSDVNPLCLIKAVGAEVHVQDPRTGERHEVSVDKYWRHEFTPVMTSRELLPFVVLSVEPVMQDARASAKKRGAGRKVQMAECVVARESDFGVNDTQFTCLTHLGHILREGDVIMGYDLSRAAWAHELGADEQIRGPMPDVILVRKNYHTTGQRKWALKALEVDEQAVLTDREREAMEDDYEDFLQQIEGDREMRAHVNLYKKNKAGRKRDEVERRRREIEEAALERQQGGGGMEEASDDGSDAGEEDEEQVRLEELLDELDLGGAHGLEEEELHARLASPEEAATAGLDLAAGATGFEPALQEPEAFSLGSTSRGGKAGKGKGGRGT